MAKVEPPRHWEDWASWGLALWLLISPWAVDFSFEASATRDAVIAGALLLALEVVTLSAFRTWEEWVNVLVGAWLVVSPFVLSFASAGARLNFVLVGGAVVMLALYELWDIGHRPPARMSARPGGPSSGA